MSPRLHTPVSFDYNLPDFFLAITVTDAVFISLILGVCLWAAWNPVSRPHLNRVSFRLLMYALVANLGYAASASYAIRPAPGAACNGTAFFANTCTLFAATMFFCMALNLHLVLVHGVNGQSMEKYYISGAFVITLACSIPPYAVGAFGYNEAIHGCWFNSLEVTDRLQWWIASIGLWLFLLSAGELFAFFTIVGSMIIRYRVISTISSGSSVPSLTLTLPKPPIVAYRNVILRIGLYPLVSCFFTVTTGSIDLHIIIDPSGTEVNWRLGILAKLLYTLRPMIYALLAATDPSLLRALRALRDSDKAPTKPITLPKKTRASELTVTSSNCDTEAGLNSIKPEEENMADSDGTEESFTRQI
ncbi:hypothetical protein B0H16DRAFT_1769753 [Mycena metata]|uniref:G-protein coupled receptors family 2 profile 2 domain-containing protein n=1 Tax=Mycena metata TaxID=1033252 RepID=A0AAD7I1L5_9AGAR|nr:hypothetical protein B0H16DRAFT_1769753 [Mycena metata]